VKSTLPSGAALLLATIVVLIAVVAALAWAVIRRSAFSHLASEVVLEQEVRQFDAVAAAVAALLRSPGGDRIFVVVTMLGEPLTWALLSTMIILALALRREWMLAIGWIIAILGSGVVDLTLKALFRRPRPAGATEFIVGHSWSFPSGHAMGSLVGYGMLAYILILHVRQPAARFAIATGAVILTVAIGMSRIYLGVHYFTDVIAGYFAGVLWLSVCITAMELVRRRAPASARTLD